jgi:serine/threonine-protein kinase
MATLLVDAPRSEAKGVEKGRLIAGRYRVERMIGKGAFGAVFEAQHVGTGQPVAIKVLSGGEHDDRLALKRFFLEARVTSGLQHPNTVRVFDFGQDDSGLVYLAMELLKGETLRRHLTSRMRNGSVLSELEAVTIAIDITRSLSEAHAAGLVHRDLKPENVFLHELPGDERVVKVLDFGIVKNMNAGVTSTGQGTCIGTPAYMSPEQAQSLGVDPRSDLYSLGVILFQLVSGRLPFVAESPVQLLLQHVNAPLPNLRELAITPNLSEDYVRVVECALAKDPADRFQDAAMMRAAMHDLSGHVRASPRPAPVMSRAASAPLQPGQISGEVVQPVPLEMPRRPDTLPKLSQGSIAAVGAGEPGAAVQASFATTPTAAIEP